MGHGTPIQWSVTQPLKRNGVQMHLLQCGWILKTWCWVNILCDFICMNYPAKYVHRKRMQRGGYQGLAAGKNGTWLLSGCRVLFGANENVLESEMMVAQHDEHIKCHWIVHFKRVHFMSCEFHLNKLSFENARQGLLPSLTREKKR